MNIFNSIDKIEEFNNNYIKDIKLWNHQKLLLKECIKEENNNEKYLALTEKPGSGKTHIILSLIQYQLLKKNNEKTLIIVNNNIYHQWIESIKYYKNLRYKDYCNYGEITSLMFNSKLDSNIDIYITTPLYYNLIFDCIKENKENFTRIVIDEIDNINYLIKDLKIDVKYLWLISGTIENENKYIKRKGNIINISEYKEFKKIYKNDYEYEIEKEEILIKKCSNISTEIFSDILDENNLNILNSLDYNTFIIKLGFKEKMNENENLLKYYKENMENEIENTKKKIEIYKKLYEDKKVNESIFEDIEILEKKYILNKKNIDKMLERVKEENKCMICFDEILYENLVCNLCCNSIYCIDCLKEWSKKSVECCYCRNKNDYSLLNKDYKDINEYINNGNNNGKIYINQIYINQIYDKIKNIKNIYDDDIKYYENTIIKLRNDINNKWNLYNEIKECKDKIPTLLEIINENNNKKIIIVNLYNNVFNKLIKVFNENDIKDYLYYDCGNLEISKKCYNEYKNGTKNILLLDGLFNSHGINFENSDIIILMHKMDRNIEKQLIARAQRPGRKNQLKVYKLYYQNEYKNII